MEEDRNRKQKGDLLVGITAMSSAANLLMAQWIIDGHTEAELDELIEALTIYLKNASVEGIDYDQQAKWILRSVETGLGFFKSFRQKSKQRTGPARSSRPASRHALRPIIVIRGLSLSGTANHSRLAGSYPTDTMHLALVQ